MSAVIVIEIVIGIVVLAAAIRFVVRDTMQREANQEPAVESMDTPQTPAHSSESEPVAAPEAAAAQPLSEVGSPEKN